MATVIPWGFVSQQKVLETVTPDRVAGGGGSDVGKVEKRAEHLNLDTWEFLRVRCYGVCYYNGVRQERVSGSVLATVVRWAQFINVALLETCLFRPCSVNRQVVGFRTLTQP